MCTNLQDPHELIPKFLDACEEGASGVVGPKPSSDKTPFFWALQSLYFRGVRSIAEVPRLHHVAGLALSALAMVMARGFLMLQLSLSPFITVGYTPGVKSIVSLECFPIFLIGLVGEYIWAVLPLVRPRPLVVESRCFHRHNAVTEGDQHG